MHDSFSEHPKQVGIKPLLRPSMLGVLLAIETITLMKWNQFGSVQQFKKFETLIYTYSCGMCFRWGPIDDLWLCISVDARELGGVSYNL